MKRFMGVGRRRVLPACIALTVVAVSGCGTGSPGSTSAWQSSSERAIGTAISGLGTVRLAVDQETRDRLPHSYAVVTATDAIDTSTKELSGYLVGQPPDRLHQANQTVAEALQDAVTLMVESRVALASPGVDRSGAHALADRIDAMTDRLDQLDSAVRSDPGSVGAR
jgi:hypothetical protein